jgi:hypothetical protein
MMDMYRRTLAAFWASQPGELKADEAVEDIFSGGDGWGKDGRPLPVEAEMEPRGAVGDANGSGAGIGSNSRPDSRTGSGANTPNMDGERDGMRNVKSAGRGIMAMSSAGRRHGHGHKHRRIRPKGHGEVDEEELIEDLRSWRIEEGVYG